MSRTPEEIRDQRKELIESIRQKWDEKREDIDIAEAIDIYLSLLTEAKGLDVWWTVKYHYFDSIGSKTVTLLGEEDEEDE